MPRLQGYLGTVVRVSSMNLGIDDVAVGHHTDPVAQTGCTVVLFPKGTVASGEIRGGAPASREFGLLGVDRMVENIDALVLSGGSAFGLAAVDGVVDWCVENDRGFSTSAGVVPIVVGLSLFDLNVGDGSIRPTRADGRRAVEAASSDFALGPVGAGTGAAMGKWGVGPDVEPTPSGIGLSTVRVGELVVSALFAVNAAGHIDDGSLPAAIAEGTFDSWPESPPFENTTIGTVVTNAKLSKVECHLVAQGAHDGFARALFPPHLRSDGDAVVAAATGHIAAEVDVVRTAAIVATELAIRSVGES